MYVVVATAEVLTISRLRVLQILEIAMKIRKCDLVKISHDAKRRAWIEVLPQGSFQLGRI